MQLNCLIQSISQNSKALQNEISNLPVCQFNKDVTVNKIICMEL